MDKVKSILRRLLIDCNEAEVDSVAAEIMAALKPTIRIDPMAAARRSIGEYANRK